MTSVGRAAAAIFFLAAAAAAAPFARGTKFGMVGLDFHSTSDTIYSFDPDYFQFGGVDPFFRVGVSVTRNLAVGADLALLNTFPLHGNLFVNAPVFAFGPVATWIPVHSGRIQAYGTVGADVVYDLARRQGWRGRVGAGALFDVGIPVTFGPEVGYYADFVHIRTSHLDSWLTGSALFIGLRLSDLKP
jgi:hypothetical protein